MFTTASIAAKAAPSKGSNTERDNGATLPRDVQELLKSYFQNRQEIEHVRSVIGTGISDNKVEKKVSGLTSATHEAVSSGHKLHASAQDQLYKCYVAVAVTEDVGRILHTARAFALPSHIDQVRQYELIKPPPLSLARKLTAVQQKMKRITAGLEDASKVAEECRESDQTLRTAADSNQDWTMDDINALLTDIDNQYTLVQRMIAYLKSELSTVSPSTDTIDEGSATGEEQQQEHGQNAGDSDVDLSFQGLRLSDATGYNARSVTGTASALSSYHRSTAALSPSPTKKPLLTPPPAPRQRTAWDKLRTTVKNANRPTYSLELFEHVLECEGEDSESAEVAAQQRPQQEQQQQQRQARLSDVFKQSGAVYRQLRSQHHQQHRATDRDANIDALLHESSPVKCQPFYVSTDSPGDWRHIQGYLQRSGATTGGSSTSVGVAAENKSTAVAFPAAYVSPLKGAMQHIQAYGERQPKTPTPAPATAVPTVSPIPASGGFASAKTQASTVGFGAAAGSAGGFEGTTLVPRRSRDSKPLEEGGAAKETTGLGAGGLTAAIAGAGAGAGIGVGQRPRSGSSANHPAGTSPPGTAKAAETFALKKSPKSNNLTGDATSTSSSADTAAATEAPAATTTGPSGAADAGASAGAGVGPDSVEEITRKLTAIYAAHAPDKASDVSKLLVKYAGREAELLEKVMKKYGVSAPAAAPILVGKDSGSEKTGVGGGTGFGALGAALASEGEGEGAGSEVTTPLKGGTSLFGGSVGAAVAPAGSGSTGSGAAATSLLGSKTAGPSATTTPTPFGAPAAAGASLFGNKAPTPTAAAAAGAAVSGTTTPLKTGGIGGLFGQPPITPALIPAPAPAADTVEGILAKVQAIYQLHNPSKLSEVPALMEKYRGQEAQMLAKLEKKYGPAPATASAPAAAGGGTPGSLFGTSATAVGAATTPKAGGLFGGLSGTGGTTTNVPAATTGGLFGKPAGAVGGTPTPFSTATGTGAAIGAVAGGASVVPNPFGNAGGSAGIGGSTTPIGAAGGGGIGSLFGASNSAKGSLFSPAPAAPSAGFGQQPTSAGSSGTGGLFGPAGQGSAGVAGTASLFASGTGTATGGGTGGLFGLSTGSGSGFNTPLGRAGATASGQSATAGSLFQAQPQAQTGIAGGIGGIGGTTSPSVFGGGPRAAMGGSLFGGGNTLGTAGATAGGGGLFSGLQQPQQQQGFGTMGGAGGNGGGSGGAALTSLQAVQQRVHDIYARHNPSKMGEIPAIMEKYRGQELQLIANLEKKYNCAGEGSAGLGAAGGGLGFGQSQTQAVGLFGGAAPAAGTGGLFSGSAAAAGTGGSGGLFSTPNRGMGGAMVGGGAGAGAGTSSLFSRPGGAGVSGGPGAAAGGGGGGLFGGLSAVSNTSTAAPSTGFGGGLGGTSAAFGSTTTLGGGARPGGFGASTGFGAGGGGSLFGGGTAGNSNGLWGNR